MPVPSPQPGWTPPKSDRNSAVEPEMSPAPKLRKVDGTASVDEAKPQRPPRDNGARKRKRRPMATDHKQNPQKLRNIIEKHRDMGSAEANADKRAYLGALKYLPHAIFKLLENMPHPWEAAKQVDVLYHTAGAITFVDESPLVDPAAYLSMWGQAWNAMRDEKRDRTSFRRMRLPPFDDEEPPVSWKDLASVVAEPPEPVSAHKPTSRFGAWKDAQPFTVASRPPTAFDFASFTTAKSLHMQVPNGPRFENPEALPEEDPGDFDDPQRIIVRPREFPVRVEAQVMFPYLHGKIRDDRNAILPSVAEPVDGVIRRHDNKRAFFLDKSVTRAPSPVPNSRNDISARPDSESLPFKPFLADFEFDEAEVAENLACYHAPYPFNEPSHLPKRAQDVPLVKSLYTNRRPLRVMAPKTRRSYQQLLKRITKLKLKVKSAKHAPSRPPPHLLKLLGSTKFFEKTRIDWLEAGMQLCQQGYQILQLLIHRRGLHFMHLDYNFNLKPTKTLTTKERKRSRFGNSFHLTRELLRMIKLVVDAHVQYRLGNVDAFELADGIHYLFTHMGQLTGIYRYKYHVMHQITACNDLKHVIYDRFNLDGVGKGPGCGIWQPSWVVWLAFLRGMLPMLERWLGNLISRQFFGRVSKGIAKTVTKQRIESHYDLELRASVLHDILDAMPEQLRRSKTKIVMQHLSEAWRCWKANITWDVPGMPEPVKRTIERYITSRAEHWIKETYTNRERIRAGKVVDKAVARKNLGRLTRLWMRAEQQEQSEYAELGPSLAPSDAVLMYKTMAGYLQAVGFTEPIEFPSVDGYANDTKLLTLALENLRGEYNMTARLSLTQREELALIEKAYDNPYEELSRIKRALQTQRVFKNIEMSLLDFHSHLAPVYHVDAAEKIVDAYLDQYLWYEASRRHLFPTWVKPSDDEVAPVMIRKFCSHLDSIPGFWSTENDETSAVIHLKLSKFLKNVDFTLLNQLLRLIVDASIADYITAKMNASLSYKDMSHLNQVGIIRGFQFSSFVVQYYLLMIDLLLLGITRAVELSQKGPTSVSNDEEDPELAHPVRAYLRNLEDVYIASHLLRPDADELVEDLSLEDDDLLPEYPTKRCWPRDRMMRLIRRDVDLGRALFGEFRNRVPETLGSVVCLDASVYSVDNPAVMFDIAGFEVRVEPRFRRTLDGGEEGEDDDDAMWYLSNATTGERTAFVSLRVSNESINQFNNRARQILMTSGSTTFAKIVKRWNTALTALAAYFREAAVATPKLLDAIVKNEIRVQNKVKMGLNSKMPARFPPCVFYSPEELGGLGMLSASHVMIPSSDLYGKTKEFKYGMTNDEEALIPNIFRYINSWDAEATDSQRVWKEYAQKRAEAVAMNSRVSLEDLEDIWDRGVPRISTLFQKDKAVLAFDKGFRIRQTFKNHSNEKYDPFWWVNSRHDGRLWNFTSYRSDVVQALGGIQTILEHTLFKATGFDDWEGLYWQKQSGFEQQMQMQKLTNAQRSGLSQIPNRRFTLWWSPTINRGNVYVGFLVQLDLTGIFLHGKIPTLKISYIQVFRAHLWQKIHESLVVDLCHILDREQSVLAFDGVEKLPIHPRKSYRMNASTADILITSANAGGLGWPIAKPSLLSADNDKFDHGSSTKFWIDVQLRYGDFDSHDITRYTRAKFLDYTSDSVSLYPSPTGVMVCIDLAYNTYDAYGYWFPGLKQLLRQALSKVMQSNPALYILRERFRKALQLYNSQPRQPHLNSENYVELLSEKTVIVDDTSVYRVTSHKTKHGNMANKPVNGALFVVTPRTGQLDVKLIHAASAWAGQKKLSAVSKWKAAEETAAVLRSFPTEELPKQVFIGTRGLRDPMEVNMLEFSEVSVRNTDFSLPFSALLAIPPFKDLVANATASDGPSAPSELHSFHLYDDWLTISQSTTAFSRLMLLLRGLTLNAEATLTVLGQKSEGAPPPPGYIWPKLDRETWAEVENAVTDIVIEEYSQAHGVTSQSLTQSEIRDIILGQKILAPSEERERQSLETNESKDTDNNVTAITTKSHNVHGDEITVVTTSKYEQQVFESRSTWRGRALEATSSLHFRAQNLEISASSDPKSRLVLPRNLVQGFVEASDVKNLVVGFLYGKYNAAHDSTEVVSLALVPQLGSFTNISFSPAPSAEDGELPDLEELELIGIIRSQPSPRSDKGISPVDLNLLASRQTSEQWEPTSLKVITLNYYSNHIEIQGFDPNQAGIDWGRKNQDFLTEIPDGYNATAFSKQAELSLTEEEGFFYVPQDNIWNYSFMTTIWNAKARPLMKIGLPISFYDSLHRPIHFARLGKLEDSFEFEDEFS